MADRKAVIEQLESMRDYHRSVGNNITADIASDALELLKEQEAVGPTIGNADEHDGQGSWWYQCGKCKMPIDYKDKFCRFCGRAVKWQ